VAADWRQAADRLVSVLSKTPQRENVRRRALQYIEERQGGTDRVCRLIENALTRPLGSRGPAAGYPGGFYSPNREVPP